jgi:hypothetical protein
MRINRSMTQIIMITELLDIRNRKLKELQFYTDQLQELKLKMAYIQQEIDLTSRIIKMIEQESLVDLKQYIKNDSSDT